MKIGVYLYIYICLLLSSSFWSDDSRSFIGKDGRSYVVFYGTVFVTGIELSLSDRKMIRALCDCCHRAYSILGFSGYLTWSFLGETWVSSFSGLCRCFAKHCPRRVSGCAPWSPSQWRHKKEKMKGTVFWCFLEFYSKTKQEKVESETDMWDVFPYRGRQNGVFFFREPLVKIQKHCAHLYAKEAFKLECIAKTFLLCFLFSTCIHLSSVHSNYFVCVFDVELMKQGTSVMPARDFLSGTDLKKDGNWLKELHKQVIS